jgi:hypothetical protein
MKKLILAGAFLAFGFSGYAQFALENNTGAASMLFAKNSETLKPADCVGDWVSAEVFHLNLMSNNKATWQDEGHIYNMAWRSEVDPTGERVIITLLGNEYCKHRNFYLTQGDNGMEIVENETNLHLHFTKDVASNMQ